MDKFKFELGARVGISISGEIGNVKGRSEHVDAERQYQVEYKAADGRAVVAWWSESSLEAIE